ncbi:MAG TPA: hypothetical protein VNA04_08770 [Thermoanaerobaculia bacterium]|nr:hypothetical protein [Thermoanaerobaculia bacterium]
MITDTRRITLICRDLGRPDRDWDNSLSAPNRVILLDSFTVLRYAISSHLVELDVDVQRLVLDRATSPADYLSLLAALPPAFTGDVLLIREDDSAFLSSLGRGGDRVLYALTATDLRFYLETHGLVTGHIATEKAVSIPNARQKTHLRAVV